jgi:dTDP-glucose 4,6-dehydratase
MKQPILVTGGAGFIGSNLVRLLLNSGESVITLDALTYAGNSANLENLKNADQYEFVQGSITDQNLISDLLEKRQPKAIIHLAAESHVDRSIADAGAFIKTNLEGTYYLLEATRQYNADEFRFIHISTDEVFGSIETGAASETAPYRPNSPYAASKAGADHLVRAWRQTYGLPVIITNYCNNYGPYQFPEKLIPLMITKAIQGNLLPAYGNGEHTRQWIYVEDHCQALKHILEHGEIGESYNIGGNTIIDNLSLVKSLCAILDELHPRKDGQPHETAITMVEDRPGHDLRYALDRSKIENTLHWYPTTKFEDGLRQTAAWYLDHRPWWQELLKNRYKGERLGLLHQD